MFLLHVLLESLLLLSEHNLALGRGDLTSSIFLCHPHISVSNILYFLPDNDPSNDVSSRRTTRSISRIQARDVGLDESSTSTRGVDDLFTKHNMSATELEGGNIHQIPSAPHIPQQILNTSNTTPSSENVVVVKRGRGRPRKRPREEPVSAIGKFPIPRCLVIQF